MMILTMIMNESIYHVDQSFSTLKAWWWFFLLVLFTFWVSIFIFLLEVHNVLFHSIRKSIDVYSISRKILWINFVFMVFNSHGVRYLLQSKCIIEKDWTCIISNHKAQDMNRLPIFGWKFYLYTTKISLDCKSWMMISQLTIR